jgi:hypothetical protein
VTTTAPCRPPDAPAPRPAGAVRRSHAPRREPARGHHRRRGHALAAGLLLAVLPTAAATAQASGSPAPPGDRWTAAGPAVPRRDLVTLGAAAVAAGALMAVDERVARWSQGPGVQTAPGVRTTASVFRAYGDPGVFVIGGATYWSGSPRATGTSPTWDCTPSARSPPRGS